MRAATKNSTRAERRAQMVARLMTAIEGLLSDGVTYSDLSVNALAKAAGTSKSRLYVYFDDKGDVLRALTHDAVAEITEATVEWWSLPSTATFGDLREVTARIFAIYDQHSHLFAAIEQATTYDQVTRAYFLELVNETLDTYAERIERGQQEGLLHPDMDARQAAQLISSTVQCGLYQVNVREGAGKHDLWIDALTRIVWNTLYAPRHGTARDA